jgi:predicted transcriptional regulator
MTNSVVEIPHYSLSPKVLTLYTTLEGNHLSDRQRMSFENLEDNTNKFNELSNHSTKRLRKAINFMIYTTTEKQIFGKKIISKNQDFTTEYEKSNKYQKPINHKLSMITLTLPSVQIHSDEIIKSQCLHQFLREIQKNYNCRDYIWKAEKQENTNIHFHILINQYIHHAKIKTIWNRITEKLGYIQNYSNRQREYYKNGFKLSDNTKDKRSPGQQRKAFEIGLKEDWKQPNSTDIHALYKVKNASAYLTKYLAKGVTKTQRTEEIKQIRRKLKELETLKINIDKEILFSQPPPAQLLNLQKTLENLENEILSQNETLKQLLETGVSGRIWGQSQSLSKLKNYTCVENWDSVPQIQEVAKNSEFKIENTIGTRKIISYIFDINKFITLDSLLKSHLHEISNKKVKPELHFSPD